MARYTGPKRRLSRREGVAIFAKDAAYLERKGAIPPGQHGISRRRRPSEYGIQLREKQKAKRIYGVMEKQFANYFKAASKQKGATGMTLIALLETRLDNIVYRLGFARSRAQARQMVTHQHVLIDGKKAKAPSYQVKQSSTVAILGKMLDNTQVKKNLQEEKTLPGWLERKATVGKVLRMPTREEAEQGINEQLIVEYYSR